MKEVILIVEPVNGNDLSMNDYCRWLDRISGQIKDGIKHGKLFSEERCKECHHKITGDHIAIWRLEKVI